MESTQESYHRINLLLEPKSKSELEKQLLNISLGFLGRQVNVF
jgi:hypothetical protein